MRCLASFETAAEPGSLERSGTFDNITCIHSKEPPRRPDFDLHSRFFVSMMIVTGPSLTSAIVHVGSEFTSLDRPVEIVDQPAPERFVQRNGKLGPGARL